MLLDVRPCREVEEGRNEGIEEVMVKIEAIARVTQILASRCGSW